MQNYVFRAHNIFLPPPNPLLAGPMAPWCGFGRLFVDLTQILDELKSNVDNLVSLFDEPLLTVRDLSSIFVDSTTY